MSAALGEAARWGDLEHLTANVLDTLRAANFQRGGAKGPKPRPVPRPGQVKKIGGKGSSRSIPEMRKLLDKWKAGGG